jgi:AcrR family transcriptional regulator
MSNRNTLTAARRETIRDAAKRLFSDQGLARTSVRDIAREAGYTTGALYFHYRSKEDLYADILKASLAHLFARVLGAASVDREPLASLGAAFRAFVDFYDEHPRDLDLSLYLMQGTRPMGLTVALDRELTASLKDTLELFRARLSDLGVAPRDLDTEVGMLLADMTGVLVTAHTGRLRVVGTDLARVVDRQVDHLRTTRGSSPGGASATRRR